MAVIFAQKIIQGSLWGLAVLEGGQLRRKQPISSGFEHSASKPRAQRVSAHEFPIAHSPVDMTHGPQISHKGPPRSGAIPAIRASTINRGRYRRLDSTLAERSRARTAGTLDTRAKGGCPSAS
ncbi:hypothetical protein ABZ319_08605 [Nocardia sp. NPDC005978]|uniref:hypothetical protein n=1 Tax=Nocardia sp. NPDC005978 TaxID=3156725 RepID=UPI0033B6E63B